MANVYFILFAIYLTVKKKLGNSIANLFFTVYVTPILFFWKKYLPLNEDVDLNLLVNYHEKLNELKHLNNYNNYIDKNKRRLLYNELKKEFENE
jgi:hypothetical protein